MAPNEEDAPIDSKRKHPLCHLSLIMSLTIQHEAVRPRHIQCLKNHHVFLEQVQQPRIHSTTDHHNKAQLVDSLTLKVAQQTINGTILADLVQVLSILIRIKAMVLDHKANGQRRPSTT